MRPTTTTSTLTRTTITSTICLITNGPVPPCRKRRQFWIDEPIFLSHPAESFIQPTNPFQYKSTHFQIISPKNSKIWISIIPRVEPTAVPMDGLKSDQHYFYPLFNGPGIYLHPSMMMAVNDYRPNLYADHLADDLYRRDPIFQRPKTRTSKKTTVMYTRTKTITENEMSTKTHTLGISGCTPRPLPYDWC